jgi:hypothetical protein
MHDSPPRHTVVQVVVRAQAPHHHTNIYKRACGVPALQGGWDKRGLGVFEDSEKFKRESLRERADLGVDASPHFALSLRHSAENPLSPLPVVARS